MKSKTIAKFTKNDEGVSVTVYEADTVDILIGIAETIQMISENSNAEIKNVMSDLNKILELLEERKNWRKRKWIMKY